MKKWKNNLDEAQEQKLLKIEHNGCWFAYWGLLISIVVQTALNPGDLKSIAAEWIIFMSLCAYIVIACLKNGIFDRHFKPTRKTSVVGSLCGSGVIALLWFIITYRSTHDLAAALISAGVGFLVTFVLIYAAMAVSIKLYKHRIKKLDDAIEE